MDYYLKPKSNIEIELRDWKGIMEWTVLGKFVLLFIIQWFYETRFKRTWMITNIPIQDEVVWWWLYMRCFVARGEVRQGKSRVTWVTYPLRPSDSREEVRVWKYGISWWVSILQTTWTATHEYERVCYHDRGIVICPTPPLNMAFTTHGPIRPIERLLWKRWRSLFSGRLSIGKILGLLRKQINDIQPEMVIHIPQGKRGWEAYELASQETSHLL